MAKGRKTGGRQKGTPNKQDLPLKEILRRHTIKYTQPNPDNEGGISDFECDLALLEPAERVNAELRMMRFHTPEMKSVDIDATVSTSSTIEDLLLSLCDNAPNG